MAEQTTKPVRPVREDCEGCRYAATGDNVPASMNAYPCNGCRWNWQAELVDHFTLPKEDHRG